MTPELASDIEVLVEFALEKGGKLVKEVAERVEVKLATLQDDEDVYAEKYRELDEKQL